MTHIESVLHHAKGFERFHPRSLRMRGLTEEQAQATCDILCNVGLLNRVVLWGEVWYYLMAQPPSVPASERERSGKGL